MVQRDDNRPMTDERQKIEREGVGTTFVIGMDSFGLEARDKMLLRQHTAGTTTSRLPLRQRSRCTSLAVMTVGVGADATREYRMGGDYYSSEDGRTHA